MKQTVAAALVFAALLVGCDHNEYEIVVTPKGRRMVRQITVARLDTATDDKGNVRKEYKAFGQEELAAIAAIYKAPVPGRKQDTYVFQATFEGATPHDVGGAGSYTSIATAMGSVHYYCERFRGSDDQAAVLQQSFRAIDQFLDILAGWLKTQLGSQKDFDKLRLFLDRDVRKDLKNLSLTLWAATNGPRLIDPDNKKAEEAIGGACAARVFQYLAERNYIRMSDIPEVYRAFTEGVVATVQNGDPKPEAPAAEAAKQKEALRRFLKYFLTAKAGVTDDQLIQEIAALLMDADGAGESLVAYYAKTDHCTKAKAEWRKRQKAAPKDQDQEEPDAKHFLTELVTQAIPGEFISFGTDDRVTLRLAIPVKPFATNGTWDGKIARVTWRGSLNERSDLKPPTGDKKDRSLPMVCYAAWGRENARFQKEHFGKVILADKDLGKYCIWRKSLAKAEAAKWDEFLASLKPDETLAAKVKAYRFQPLKPGQKPDEHPDYAQQGTEILLKALNGNGDTK